MEQREQLVTTLMPAKYEQLSVTETKRWKTIWKQRVVIGALVLSDILLALLVWGVAYALHNVWGQGALSGPAIAVVVPTIAAWIGLRASLGMYRGYGLDRVEDLRRSTFAVLATLAIVAIFAVSLQFGELLSRPLLTAGFAGLLLLAPLTRHFVERGLNKIGVWGKPVVILGAGGMGSMESGAYTAQLLQRNWQLGYKPVVVYDFRQAPVEEPEGPHGSPGGAESFEQIPTDAAEMARRQGADTAIIAMPHTRHEQVARVVSWTSVTFRNVLIIPNLDGATNSAVVARNLAGICAVEIRHNLLNPWAQRIKRGIDLFGTVVGGVIISPLMLALFVLIKLDSPGPAFYGHRRLGTGHRHFRCWKFRTMHPDAEWLLDKWLQNNPHLRFEWNLNQKLRNDPRVTRVGRFLRKTSLDELPQLWNVLRGEMSLIGPRPIVDAEVPRYGEAYELYGRVKPGMSGLWQVSGRSDTSYEERVKLDSYYVRDWSVWLDLVLLARTVRTVLLDRGAY